MESQQHTIFIDDLSYEKDIHARLEHLGIIHPHVDGGTRKVKNAQKEQDELKTDDIEFIFDTFVGAKGSLRSSDNLKVLGSWTRGIWTGGWDGKLNYIPTNLVLDWDKTIATSEMSRFSGKKGGLKELYYQMKGESKIPDWMTQPLFADFLIEAVKHKRLADMKTVLRQVHDSPHNKTITILTMNKNAKTSPDILAEIFSEVMGFYPHFVVYVESMSKKIDWMKTFLGPNGYREGGAAGDAAISGAGGGGGDIAVTGNTAGRGDNTVSGSINATTVGAAAAVAPGATAKASPRLGRKKRAKVTKSGSEGGGSKSRKYRKKKHYSRKRKNRKKSKTYRKQKHRKKSRKS